MSVLGPDLQMCGQSIKSHSFLWHRILAPGTHTLKHGEKVGRRGCGKKWKPAVSIIQFYRRAFSMLVKTMKIRHLRKPKKGGAIKI